jgi:hypothetical protein
VQGSELIVGFVVLEGENGERARFVEAIFRQEIGKDGSHLLETQGDLAAFFFPGISDDRVMGRVNFEPRGLDGGTEGHAEDNDEDAYAERDGQESRHGHRAEGLYANATTVAFRALSWVWFDQRKGPAMRGLDTVSANTTGHACQAISDYGDRMALSMIPYRDFMDATSVHL